MYGMKKNYLLVFLFLFSCLQAQTLSLDPTFGINGYHKYHSAELTSVAMLPDGQFITATFSSSSITIKKIDQTGNADAVFGTKYHNIGTNATLKSEAVKKIILHNNKMIIIGRVNATPNHSAYELFISRINLDGTLDTTFGTNGFTTFSVGDDSRAIDAVIDPNGNTYFHATQNSTNFIAKISANGILDMMYGTNGILSINPFTCSKMYLQNDGKILLAGYKNDAVTALRESYLERRLQNGNPDLSFGSNGIVIIPSTAPTTIRNFHYDDVNNSITILHQTSSSTSDTRLFLSKIQISDGTLISSFGNNGITSQYLYADASDIFITGFTVLPNSKMIAVGNMSDFFGTNGTIVAQLFVARFNADGTKDTGLSAYGYKMFPATPPNTSVRADNLNNIFITNSGSLVVAYSGSSATHGSSAYLARFTGAFLGVESAMPQVSNQMILYPNPANQSFSVQNIKNNDDRFDYKVYDVSGKIITKGTALYNQSINVQHLRTGSYIVQISNEDGRKHSLKLLKY
jgi:uncharacterized delta-60 repeat protein